MESIFNVVFSRCPVGSATELIIRKEWLQSALMKKNARFVLLQSMEKRFHSAHFTQLPPLHFRDGGNIPPIWAQSQGDRSVLLGFSYQNEVRGIYVRNDAPIYSVADLKDCKIAIDCRPDALIDFRYLTAVRGVESALEYYGLSMEKVTLVPILCKNIITQQTKQYNVYRQDTDFLTEDIKSVLTKKTDAVFAHSIKAVRHDKAGLLRNILSDQDQREIPNINNNAVLAITCTREFAYAHPEIVITYLSELIKAAGYIRENHDDFLECAASGVYGATPEEMKASFEHEQLFSRMPEFSDKGLSMLNDQKELMLRYGKIEKEKDFDIGRWADPSFLDAAFQAVT